METTDQPTRSVAGTVPTDFAAMLRQYQYYSHGRSMRQFCEDENLDYSRFCRYVVQTYFKTMRWKKKAEWLTRLNGGLSRSVSSVLREPAAVEHPNPVCGKMTSEYPPFYKRLVITLKVTDDNWDIVQVCL